MMGANSFKSRRESFNVILLGVIWKCSHLKLKAMGNHFMFNQKLDHPLLGDFGGFLEQITCCACNGNFGFIEILNFLLITAVKILWFNG
jgi:hypothetical protein